MTRPKAVAQPITVQVRASRKATETLRLEIRRLAARLGIPAAAVRVRRIDEGRR